MTFYKPYFSTSQASSNSSRPFTPTDTYSSMANSSDPIDDLFEKHRLRSLSQDRGSSEVLQGRTKAWDGKTNLDAWLDANFNSTAIKQSDPVDDYIAEAGLSDLVTKSGLQASWTPKIMTTPNNVSKLGAMSDTPFSVTKNTHQSLFTQLKDQVAQLKDKLHESETLNQSLKDKLDQSITTQQGDSAQASPSEDQQKLERELKHTRLTCNRLRLRLEQTCDFLTELLAADPNTDRCAKIREFIQENRDMTSNLSVSLKAVDDETSGQTRNFEVRRLGNSEVEGEARVDLEKSYQRAVEQIQQLELQLAKRDQGPDTKTVRQVNQLQEQIAQLKKDKDQLLHEFTGNKDKLHLTEQERTQLKESNAHLQNEINRLRKDWLSIKDDLSSEKVRSISASDLLSTLEKQLEASNAEVSEVRALLMSEQDKCRGLEDQCQSLRDKSIESAKTKDGLSKRLIESESIRETINEEKIQIEERLLALQKQFNDTMEQCNNLRVSQAAIQADLEEVRGQRDRLNDTLNDKDELVSKLKALLRDNQITAEGLRQELQKLNDEVDCQDTARLHEHIRQIQHRYHSTPVISSLKARPQEIDPSPIKPAYRHHSDRTRSKSSQRRVVEQGVYPDHRKSSSHLTMGGASEDLPEEHREALDILQQQLEATMELNKALREELALHSDFYNTSSHNANYTRPELQQHLQEIHMLRERLQDSIQSNDRLRCLLEKRLLGLGIDTEAVKAALSSEHAELRNQLEELNECIMQKDSNIQDLRRQLDCAEQQLTEYKCRLSELEKCNACLKREIHYKTDLVNELQARLQHKEETIELLNLDIEEKKCQIKCFKDENKRLADELTQMQAALREMQQMNNCLHNEMCQLQRQVEMEGSALSEMLGCELRGLRGQLERSIDNNQQLQQHLEDRLPQIPNKFKHGHKCEPSTVRNPCNPCGTFKAAPRSPSATRGTSNSNVDAGMGMVPPSSSWAPAGGLDGPLYASTVGVMGCPNNSCGAKYGKSAMGSSYAEQPTTRQPSRYTEQGLDFDANRYASPVSPLKNNDPCAKYKLPSDNNCDPCSKYKSTGCDPCAKYKLAGSDPCDKYKSAASDPLAKYKLPSEMANKYMTPMDGNCDPCGKFKTDPAADCSSYRAKYDATVNCYDTSKSCPPCTANNAPKSELSRQASNQDGPQH